MNAWLLICITFVCSAYVHRYDVMRASFLYIIFFIIVYYLLSCLAVIKQFV